jgi:serine/threonine-protein kinase
MSPEQVRGGALDGRSDIFSLGTILYEITLGRRLWQGPKETVMRRIVEEAPPPPTYYQRDYSPALELIVMRALEKRVEDRYQSAGEMRADLEKFLVEHPATARRSRVAAHIDALFEDDVELSEAGVKRARAFVEDEPVDEDGSEVLDLDGAGASGSGAGLARVLAAAGPLVPAPQPPSESRGSSSRVASAESIVTEAPLPARRSRALVGILLLLAALVGGWLWVAARSVSLSP